MRPHKAISRAVGVNDATPLLSDDASGALGRGEGVSIDPIVIASFPRTPMGGFQVAPKARGGKRGLANLCIGGREATAMEVELI